MDRRACSQVPVPVAGLRPPFRDHGEPRHRDDRGAGARGRPGRRPDRRTRGRGPRHQGHVVRAGLLQPDRRHVLVGGRAATRPNENGGNRFPVDVGQRLCGAHAEPRFHPASRCARAGRSRRQPEPAGAGVRVDVEDHLRGCRRQLPRRLTGQHRLVSAAVARSRSAFDSQPACAICASSATPT